MEGTNLLVLFVVGFVLGCTIVMLLWMSSPGCLLSQVAGGEGAQAGTPANLSSAGGTSSTMVIRDEGGRTLATTGQRGTPSVFTDERGNTRNLVCYTSYYCVDETPCEDTCDDDECVDYGKMCGYWPGQTSTLAANMPSEGRDYGECCPPYECMDGYCGNEQGCVPTGEKCTYDNDCCEGQCINGICGQEGCQQQYEICGLVYPTQTATTAYNPNPVDYGDCCPPYECVNNKCEGEEQCVETGQTCGTTYPAGATANYPIQNGECCPPDECINNVCTSEEPCVETGAMCGYGPATSTTYTNVANRTWHGDCCDGNICTNGYCVEDCENVNEKCTELQPCCNGLECQGGVCRAPCVEIGATCAVGQIECCDPYFCVSGKCAECQPGGYTCASDAECCENYFCGDNKRCERYSACMNENAECGKDSDCCDGLVCSDGICREEGTCTDTDQGQNQYSQGTATGMYQGDYGSYTDYCEYTGASMLYEYYCDGDEVALVMMTCPQACNNGECG